MSSPALHRVNTKPTLLVLAILALLLGACSEDSLAGLGGKSSDWIGEVATTRPSTTTTVAATVRSQSTVQWANDGFPRPGSDNGELLATVFGRTDGSSQYLQASRHEIAVLVPEVEFPITVPVETEYVTSQVVVESRTLQLSTNPTVAFGLWSVEPYSRSRSIGQVGVLSAALDETAARVANDPDSQPTCAAFTQSTDVVCGIEQLGGMTVWRLESASGLVHIWYRGKYRYELSAPRLSESVAHQVIESMTPLAELVDVQAG